MHDPGYGVFERVFTGPELAPAPRRVVHLEYAATTHFGPGLDLAIG